MPVRGVWVWLTFEGPVTCVAVKGNRAVIGFDAFLGPMKAVVVDNGSTGSPADQFGATPTATDCSDETGVGPVPRRSVTSWSATRPPDPGASTRPGASAPAPVLLAEPPLVAPRQAEDVLGDVVEDHLLAAPGRGASAGPPSSSARCRTRWRSRSRRGSAWPGRRPRRRRRTRGTWPGWPARRTGGPGRSASPPRAPRARRRAGGRRPRPAGRRCPGSGRSGRPKTTRSLA